MTLHVAQKTDFFIAFPRVAFTASSRGARREQSKKIGWWKSVVKRRRIKHTLGDFSKWGKIRRTRYLLLHLSLYPVWICDTLSFLC